MSASALKTATDQSHCQKQGFGDQDCLHGNMYLKKCFCLRFGPKLELEAISCYEGQKILPQWHSSSQLLTITTPNPSTVPCCPPQCFGNFCQKNLSPKAGCLATKKVTMMIMTVRRFEWVFIASPPVRCHCATMEWGGYSSHPDPILYMCYSCLAPLANEHFSAQSEEEEGIHTGRYDSRDG